MQSGQTAEDMIGLRIQVLVRDCPMEQYWIKLSDCELSDTITVSSFPVTGSTILVKTGYTITGQY